jgi:hypothetical protein
MICGDCKDVRKAGYATGWCPHLGKLVFYASECINISPSVLKEKVVNKNE